MERRELEGRVRQALDMLYAHDSSLLVNDAAEWSVAHRLAVYLEQLLPGWNVDCEYNRQGLGQEPKKRTAGALVRPDIIVHHRGRIEREHNLLAIELKKATPALDSSKACEYTAPPDAERSFEYQYGLALAVVDGPHFTWFEDGRVSS
jgi:hypothetical protein